MKTRASQIAAVVLLAGFQTVSAVAGNAPQAKTPSDPWQTYRAYLAATRGGDLEPYLTDEGRAQWRAFSPAARNAAERVLFVSGPEGAELVSSRIDGNRAQLDATLYLELDSMRQKDGVKAHVELVRGDQGWGIRSETLTPLALPDFYGRLFHDAGRSPVAPGSWAGLRAPGVFPPSVQAKADAQQLQDDMEAINDVRAVIAAESSYMAADVGDYDRLECLRAPSKCIPGYPQRGTIFLNAQLGLPRDGYHPRIDLGPAAPAASGASPSGAVSYAYWLIPDPGHAARAYCGDATGRVCFLSGGAPPVTKGECPIQSGSCVIVR